MEVLKVSKRSGRNSSRNGGLKRLRPARHISWHSHTFVPLSFVIVPEQHWGNEGISTISRASITWDHEESGIRQFPVTDWEQHTPLRYLDNLETFRNDIRESKTYRHIVVLWKLGTSQAIIGQQRLIHSIGASESGPIVFRHTARM